MNNLKILGTNPDRSLIVTSLIATNVNGLNTPVNSKLLDWTK